MSTIVREQPQRISHIAHIDIPLEQLNLVTHMMGKLNTSASDVIRIALRAFHIASFQKERGCPIYYVRDSERISIDIQESIARAQAVHDRATINVTRTSMRFNPDTMQGLQTLLKRYEASSIDCIVLAAIDLLFTVLDRMEQGYGLKLTKGEALVELNIAGLAKRARLRAL